MSGTKLNFRIKLLSGNNVVMVEANGYESEIFMPQIMNGRITFQNIIPNRRCCLTSASISTKDKCYRMMPTMSSQTNRKPLYPMNSNSSWRMSAGQENQLKPVAFSTPALDIGKENRRRFDSRTEPTISQSSTLPTPELPRHAVPTPYEVVKDTLVQIPSGIKVIRLYRDATPNTPKNVGRINTSSLSNVLNTSRQNKSSMLNCTKFASQDSNNSSFRLPDTPELSIKRKSTFTNPTQSSLQKQVNPGSATKWRKCITPIRTYARRQIQKRCSVGSIKKTLNTSIKRSNLHTSISDRKVLPTFMVNPTQGTKSNVKVEVKKRKIIIDPKITITPRTFKKQHKDTSDLKCRSKYQLPKTRKHYEASKQTAFDLLTNSNRVSHMSTKLREQFRKGCVNKVCSTYPKYKMLCTIPPLNQDEQTNIATQPLPKQPIPPQGKEIQKSQVDVNFKADLQERATKAK